MDERVLDAILRDSQAQRPPKRTARRGRRSGLWLTAAACSAILVVLAFVSARLAPQAGKWTRSGDISRNQHLDRALSSEYLADVQRLHHPKPSEERPPPPATHEIDGPIYCWQQTSGQCFRSTARSGTL
jgi:hypothetical protein